MRSGDPTLAAANHPKALPTKSGPIHSLDFSGAQTAPNRVAPAKAMGIPAKLNEEQALHADYRGQRGSSIVDDIYPV